MLRFCLLGAGRIGKAHAADLAAHHSASPICPKTPARDGTGCLAGRRGGAGRARSVPRRRTARAVRMRCSFKGGYR